MMPFFLGHRSTTRQWSDCSSERTATLDPRCRWVFSALAPMDLSISTRRKLDRSNGQHSSWHSGSQGQHDSGFAEPVYVVEVAGGWETQLHNREMPADPMT